MRKKLGMPLGLLYVAIIATAICFAIPLTTALVRSVKSGGVSKYQAAIASSALVLSRHGEWLLLKSKDGFMAIKILPESGRKQIGYAWITSPDFGSMVKLVEEVGFGSSSNSCEELEDKNLLGRAKIHAPQGMYFGEGQSAESEGYDTLDIHGVKIPWSCCDGERTWLYIADSTPPLDIYIDQYKCLGHFNPPGHHRWIYADVYR